MTSTKPLRRGEHRPCVALQQTVCGLTRRIAELNAEEDRLRPEDVQLRSMLQNLSGSIRQFEALSRLPDTGAALDEIERRRRRNALLRNFNSAVRRSRGARLSADVAIEGVRSASRLEVERLRSEEARLAGEYQAVIQRLRDIPAERRSAEGLLAEAGRRAGQEGCDPDFVNRFCG